MKFVVNGQVKKVTLRAWSDGQWGPDFFADMETNAGAYSREDDAYNIAAEDFAQMVEYWQSEVDDYNAGRRSKQFGDKAENTAEEFGLWVDDV